MSQNANITKILNGTIQSVKNVLPMSVTVSSPSLFKEKVIKSKMSVLIGMTGDVKGRIVIDANPTTFSSIGQSMYGMELEGEMLESFTGELGNMIAGNLATNASQNELLMDITPPTILVGEAKLSGFSQAILVPVSVSPSESLDIILMLENQ
ncbi:chemotaxis protein CheX [Bacillus pinisoli]|uniref:chemotaxis protein CheX n=1 Tax=Bacillus pinisoli TaxID=2901866 RepID=UPI001FF15E60